MHRHNNTPQGEPRAAIAIPQPAGIREGDRVRLYDGLLCAYFWHTVTEIISGARPKFKVAAYDFYISAALVSNHQKGGAR